MPSLETCYQYAVPLPKSCYPKAMLVQNCSVKIPPVRCQVGLIPRLCFSHFLQKNWVDLLSALHCQDCVLECDAYGLKFCGKRSVWLNNSKAILGLLIVHFLPCLLVLFVKGFLFRKVRFYRALFLFLLYRLKEKCLISILISFLFP